MASGGRCPWQVADSKLLLLEGRQSGTQQKLSKFHGAVGTPTLERVYTAEALCGILANACGLRPDPGPTTPSQLLDDFSDEETTPDGEPSFRMKLMKRCLILNPPPD